MTTEDDEAADDDTNNDDLDLDALFESVSNDDVDPDDEVDGSESEDPSAGSMVFEGTDSEATPSETPSDTDESSRFDAFKDRIGGSEPGSDSPAEAKDINDLLNRMNDGETQSTQPGRNIDVESFVGTEGGDAGDESSDSGDSSGTGQFEMAAMEGLSGASDVLFRAARGGGLEPDICQSFFSTYSPAEQNVLLVSLRQSAADRLQAFHAGAAGSPENIAIISSDEAYQSPSDDAGDVSEVGRSDVISKVIDDPGNLTRLGITISEVLNSWEDDDNHTLVCFDSLSMLLQYADLQRVFRFIHVLQGRLSNVNATTHYHLNPEAHESQTEATLRSLFDGVIRVTDAGELVYE